MTKVHYKVFDNNNELQGIVETLAEARSKAKEVNGRYETYYTYRETYSEGHAWKFKRLSNCRT